ncbi:genetransfer agent host specificity protein [alpha proteobacterium U9-1i]|nr:genetransfer agent host specificity protein [alpha proteobacterium U9-1i]
MAELIFSTIGETLGARLAPAALRTLGSALGRVGGAMLGRSIDQRLFGETARYEGARLTDLHVQSSTEGASMPAVFGRVRIAGQVIWAARFKEHAETSEVSGGGGKGGAPRATRTDYRYTISFAVGLCEGEVSYIGRAWANGEAFDLSGVTWRLHKGAEDQAPDALIEAIEGAEQAPAYRGLAYIVFEDLPLDQFGATIPQLSFEVVRPARAETGPRLEDLVRGVCLIPGSGEFAYATEPVVRVIGPGEETPENVHAERNRPNLLVSLDQLATDFPNCEWVSLVVAWFGDDLRCGHCQIRPGVELAAKVTAPMMWRVGSVDREDAYVVSHVDGAPAYGGAPSDESVTQAIAELRGRGYKVALCPFILMDVPDDNGLPDPYGGAEQARYPWRGRIGLHPAAGEVGSPDKTSAATPQIAAFFGAADPSDFGVSDGCPTYSGPAEWSYRRFILHHAKLASLSGGVDAFIVGSEMRALTTARASATSFPAVAALRALAADVRTILPDATLTYAADWSEYHGYQPADGSGDVLFHLDPLWSDANIDVIGIDWYPPLTDWRDGRTHLDAALARDAYDLTYLQSRIEGGEAFDYWYADGEARADQTRSLIADGAHDEPWIFRAKDIRNFWGRAHHDRLAGVRSSSPTDWIPESKPIWLMELGCPALDKGANAPNLFIDEKSSESAAPPFSSGTRNDLIQRRTLEAYLDYWDNAGGHNAVSSVDGRLMIGAAFVWAWDARPYPAFPARADVWSDGAAWRRGHWLNGRAGLSRLGEVVSELCLRANVSDADVSALRGAVSGYVADAPATARALLDPLMAAYDFVSTEREGRISFFHSDQTEPLELDAADFAASDGADLFANRMDHLDRPIEARVRFLDATRDYLIAGVSARRLDAAAGGVETIDAPLVLEADIAEALAQRVLADRRAASESVRASLGPAHLALEPGDRVTFEGVSFEVARIEDAETRAVELRRARTSLGEGSSLVEPSAPPPPAFAPTPAFALLDLPSLPGAEADDRPLAAVFASPWHGTHEIHAGASDDALTLRARATRPAIMGELLWALWPGPVGRWDDGNRVRVKLYGSAALVSASADATLNGANVFAVEASGGAWEILQARECVLVAPGEYELSGLLRAQLGSEHAMTSPHLAGARIVKLDARLARAQIASHEWGETMRLSAPPAGAAPNDPRTSRLEVSLSRAASRPWAPAHLRALRGASGAVTISWVRRAHRGGDYWGAGDAPLGFGSEAYRLDILDGSTLKRSVNVAFPSYVYSVTDQTADFGAPPSSLKLRVVQFGEGGATGLNKELTILL